MEAESRARRSSWINPRLRVYKIKERPKSWVYGNYRKTLQEENATAEGAQKPKPRPPTPPVRSPLTRLQSDQSMIQMGSSTRNKEDEEGLNGETLNGSNEKSNSPSHNNINDTRNAITQDKDFILEI